MSKKILHIANSDKFIPPFIEFVKEHFEFSEHEFLLTGGMAQDQLKPHANVQLSKRTILGRRKHYTQAVIKMHQAQKVILHGLFDIKLVYILFFMPWLLKNAIGSCGVGIYMCTNLANEIGNGDSENFFAGLL